jgi:Trypsin-like peptidase domain
MTLAIARLEAFWSGLPAVDGGSSSAGRRYGTAFAVSPIRALTAFHCVGDLESGEIRSPRVWLRFRSGTIEASVEGGDAGADFAVLRLNMALPAAEEPLRLVGDCVPHERWYSVGFPAAVADVDGYALSGTVTLPDARILHGAAAIQLHCEQSAASLPLEGVSGAPVLVGGSPTLAVGVVRWNPEADGTAGVAAGAAIFATPVAGIGAAVPLIAELLLPHHEAQHGRDQKAEKALMDQLPLARRGRLGGISRVAIVATAATALLLSGGTAAVLATTGVLPGGRAAEAPATPGPATVTTLPSRPPTTSPTTTAARPTSERPVPPPPQTTRAPRPSTTNPPPPPPPPPPVVTSRPPDCSTSITIQPSSGPVGTEITVSGNCFQPGERVDVRFHTDVISQVPASSTGSFVTSGTVPASYQPFAGSQFSVTATGKDSIRSDSQPFNLTE